MAHYNIVLLTYLLITVVLFIFCRSFDVVNFGNKLFFKHSRNSKLTNLFASPYQSLEDPVQAFAKYSHGRIQGAPYFWQSQFYFFYIVYNVWKIFLKLNFLFYIGRNPRSFWKCGGCMRVCVSVWSHRPTWQISRFLSIYRWVSKSWPLLFFVLQRSNFERYLTPFWSQIYMPDCRKSHLIFQNFLGEAPRPLAGGRAFGARFGASPPYRPPFQNSWIRPWQRHFTLHL